MNGINFHPRTCYLFYHCTPRELFEFTRLLVNKSDLLSCDSGILVVEFLYFDSF